MFASTPKFKRPESVEFPSVWLRFEGKRPGADGALPKYRVEDVTDDKIDEICGYSKDFVKDEIISRAVKDHYPSPANFDLSFIWRALLSQKVSLQCVTDDDERKLVAFNINEIVTEPKQTDFGNLANIYLLVNTMVAMNTLKNEADIFKRWNEDVYVDAYGLFVVPEFRGQGISKYILQASQKSTLSSGSQCVKQWVFGATANTFSSDIARISAANIGFELLNEISLPEISRRYNIKMSGVTDSDALKYMGMKIE